MIRYKDLIGDRWFESIAANDCEDCKVSYITYPHKENSAWDFEAVFYDG